MKKKSVVPGMPGLVDPRVVRVRSNASTLTVDFEDGRTVRLPLIWFPRLFRASQAQRDHRELIGPGLGVHWPELDEYLSAEGLAGGRPCVEYLNSRNASPAREVHR